MRTSVHFISGLPRSGSTLLAGILRQNPRFHADMTGPVAQMCSAVHQTVAGTGEFSVLFDEPRRAQMLRGVFDTYYQAIPTEHVVFDTNRSWTAKAALVGTLYPKSRIICCVREIGWVLDSLERIRLKHPLSLSRLYPSGIAESIYARVDALMNGEKGLVGLAWATLREAWFSESAHRLIVIPYEILVQRPEKTIRRLYAALDEPFFQHDFANIEYEAPDYDSHLGTPGLHTVRRQVAQQDRQPVIPPDLFTKYANSHFWDTSGLNHRNVAIL
jgi:sulfotransferase